MSSQNPSLPTPQGLDRGGQVCCETGRPVTTDPVTGQRVCSCQYEAQLLSIHRLASAGLPMYGTAASYPPDSGPYSLGADPAAFFPPTMPGSGFELKDGLDAWRMLPYASLYYPYDAAAFPGYPFATGYGMDLNGARRKNATRETTSTLKAWLNEHRKNPYPTKGEKIMLAIITKMTLTQVSTWFANARRRLKKENKMTWEPRNRCDEEDEDLEDDMDVSLKKSDVEDENEDGEAMESRTRERQISEVKKIERDGSHACNSPSYDDCITCLSPASSQSKTPDPNNAKADLQNQEPQTKPRIWSIVDMATSKTSVTPETDRSPSLTSNHNMLIPLRGSADSPRAPLEVPGLLHPLVTSNWYAPPLTAPHLASHHQHVHHPPPPSQFSLNSASSSSTHPAFHGIVTPGSNCHPAMAVLNDSVAVATSLTRLRNAAATATSAAPGSSLNPMPSSLQRSTSCSSHLVGGHLRKSPCEVTSNISSPVTDSLKTS